MPTYQMPESVVSYQFRRIKWGHAQRVPTPSRRCRTNSDSSRVDKIQNIVQPLHRLRLPKVVEKFEPVHALDIANHFPVAFIG